jgi:hypothetical protein
VKNKRRDLKMAGAACKVVINNGVKALMESIERILLDVQIHANRLTDDERLDLIQRLADVDISTYTGKESPMGGLTGILIELEGHGLVTDEVWQIYNRPAEATAKSRE